MIDIELPACFYLGKEYRLEDRTLGKPILYEARDLTTHGVVVGMTGSGKTGLCLTLLEEAAIDGFPCVIIDLKGDLSNLLLQFPELRPEDFLPWIDPAEARRKKRTPEDHARHVAETWRKGLAEWGQTPDRIRRLQASSEWRIYTPGSEAGLPLSVLASFAAPPSDIGREALTERVEATASGVLGLTAAASDPIQSREHILIANLLMHSWMQGKDLTLERIIHSIQNPPFSKIGAFDIETFYPEKDRMRLAVALNNILASPSFASWITGEPLDLSKLLYAADGRPRQCIFYLAHLDDSQRMFFLTLLLEEILAWTRAQPGTTNLRAVVYFDEVFGYLPPHPHNPPTKQPLMTLMKQARAFGVGVLLATQNPVDLDYKALTNAGTWFVGKLQTERDKARLLDGLESVCAAQGTLTDRKHIDQVISSLGSRTFLMHNVHHGPPVVMQTRWALSYLAGPLTRDHVARLMAPVKSGTSGARNTQPDASHGADKSKSEVSAATDRSCPECGVEVKGSAKFCPECGTRLPPKTAPEEEHFKREVAAEPSRKPLNESTAPPVLSSDIPQFFVPVVPLARLQSGRTEARLHYEARVYGCAEIHYADARRGFFHQQTLRGLAIPPGGPSGQGWHQFEPLAEDALTLPPSLEATYGPVPASMNDARKLRALERSFVEFLYANAIQVIHHNRHFGLCSEAEEDFDAFLERCRAAAQTAMEAEVADLERKFRKRLEALDASLRAARTELEQSQAMLQRRKNEELLRSGSSILRTLLGWGRSAPKLPNTDYAGERRVQRATSEVEKRRQERERFVADYHQGIAAIRDKWQQKAEDIRELRLSPRKSDIRVLAFGLAWTPHWILEVEGAAITLPAYAARRSRPTGSGQG